MVVLARILVDENSKTVVGRATTMTVEIVVDLLVPNVASSVDVVVVVVVVD